MRVALLPPWPALAGFTCHGGAGPVVARSACRAARHERRAHAGRSGHSSSRSSAWSSCCSLSPLPARRAPRASGSGRTGAAGHLADRDRAAGVGALAIAPGDDRSPAGLAADASRPCWSAAITLVVSGVAAARLTGTVLFPAGDEPHYLVIAQSLWRDGDLKIENNHTQRDYKEYFAPDLEPHYLTRGADNEIYSIHPVGMPVLMAPVYAAGGYPAVVAAFVIMASVGAALMWLAIVSFSGSTGAATFAWVAVALTTPFLFNSFAIYPEIPAALAVVIAFIGLVDATERSSWRRWLLVGVAAATLPWLSTKYAPMSAAIVTIALARVAWPRPTRPTSLSAVTGARRRARECGRTRSCRI